MWGACRVECRDDGRLDIRAGCYEDLAAADPGEIGDAAFERILANQHRRDPQAAARDRLWIECPALAVGDDHDVARLRLRGDRVERGADLGAAGRLRKLLDQRRDTRPGRLAQVRDAVVELP